MRITTILLLLIVFLSFTIVNILSLFCRYNVQWYTAPLHIQKMMLFLLQRSTKAFHLILGGVFVASMESAASVRNIYHIYNMIHYILYLYYLYYSKIFYYLHECCLVKNSVILKYPGWSIFIKFMKFYAAYQTVL